MTLIHLYRKYKTWNPVHLTAGAFWGFGIGAGCGVGWGPGFGPECIGYVGSGCGVGFNVGLTFAGVGVGLPVAGIAALPWDTLSYTSRQTTGRSGQALRVALRAWDQLAESEAVRQAGQRAGSSWDSLGQHMGLSLAQLGQHLQGRRLGEVVGEGFGSAKRRILALRVPRPMPMPGTVPVPGTVVDAEGAGKEVLASKRMIRVSGQPLGLELSKGLPFRVGR